MEKGAWRNGRKEEVSQCRRRMGLVGKEKKKGQTAWEDRDESSYSNPAYSLQSVEEWMNQRSTRRSDTSTQSFRPLEGPRFCSCVTDATVEWRIWCGGWLDPPFCSSDKWLMAALAQALGGPGTNDGLVGLVLGGGREVAKSLRLEGPWRETWQNRLKQWWKVMTQRCQGDTKIFSWI